MNMYRNEIEVTDETGMNKWAVDHDKLARIKLILKGISVGIEDITVVEDEFAVIFNQKCLTDLTVTPERYCTSLLKTFAQNGVDGLSIDILTSEEIV